MNRCAARASRARREGGTRRGGGGDGGVCGGGGGGQRAGPAWRGAPRRQSCAGSR